MRKLRLLQQGVWYEIRTQMKNSGASSWVLRWRGNCGPSVRLYWQGPYPVASTNLWFDGVWTRPV
ncbi:MAG: hypothetical protein LBB83_11595 [Treponema sp.]|nr:hypothetical protein [Treponema sp.]